MNCGLCDSTISQCASCRLLSCSTPLCSRCAAAQPETHPVLLNDGPTLTLGEPVPISMDW